MTSNTQEKALIRQNIHENSTGHFAYFFMNVLATILASYGLLSDSTAVVIGAMLVAMLLGPITGVALALVDGEVSLLKKAFITEFLGVLCVLTVSFIIGLLNPYTPIGTEILARTSPNIMDLIIAMAGGAAGTYSIVSPKLNIGLVGVAIATALVPPLASASILFSRGEFDLASGAFLLFFTNFVGIQVASSMVLWAHGYHKLSFKQNQESQEEKTDIFQRNLFSFLVLILLAFSLGNNFWDSMQKQQQEQQLRKLLKEEINKIPGGNLDSFKIEKHHHQEILFVVVNTPRSIAPQEVDLIEKNVQKLFPDPVELHVRSILISEATKNGYIYAQPSFEDSENRLFEKIKDKIFSQIQPTPVEQSLENTDEHEKDNTQSTQETE